MATRVLLIDDDPKIVSLLQRGLAFEGFDVTTAPDGTTGLSAAAAQPPQVVLLDIAMPELDGFEVCRRLRLAHDVPIIMLTARDDVADKVTALNMGADDYVAKPFAFDELLARMRAVMRRHQVGDQPLTYLDLTVTAPTREVHRSGRALELTSREFDLLLYFMRHPRQVLTRQQLVERIWGYDESPETNALEVHIGHLRQKLEANGAPRLIQTIRGIGYALRG